MTEETSLIPNSFDDFLNPQVVSDKEEVKEEDSLATKFANERLEWLRKIKEMAEHFKNVFKMSELQIMVYTERQIALEYYHHLLSYLIGINKSYNKVYAEKYDFYSYKSQKRFPNETSKNNQILHEMAELLEKKQLIENQSKYMDNTIKSIDQIIFGIKLKIDGEILSRK